MRANYCACAQSTLSEGYYNEIFSWAVFVRLPSKALDSFSRKSVRLFQLSLFFFFSFLSVAKAERRARGGVLVDIAGRRITDLLMPHLFMTHFRVLSLDYSPVHITLNPRIQGSDDCIRISTVILIPFGNFECLQLDQRVK